jgi:hypothetical protein
MYVIIIIIAEPIIFAAQGSENVPGRFFAAPQAPRRNFRFFAAPKAPRRNFHVFRGAEGTAAREN